MLQWIINMIAGGVVGAFGDHVVQPIINAYLSQKNIDLQKEINSNSDLTTISSAILHANVQQAELQEQFASGLLKWWPFRVILFSLMIFPAIHFCMAIADNSLVYFFGMPYGVFSVPALHGDFQQIENQLLLTFIIAHPVDSLVSGAVSLIGKYIRKNV